MFYRNQTKQDIKYAKKNYKIIKRFSYLNSHTKKNEPWVKLKIENEPTKVLGLQLRVTHFYDVPKRYINKPSKYIDPLDNFDYNTKHNFIAYRKKLGLMPASLIIKLRHKYGLTQKQTANLLHINFSHYQLIETGNLMREKEWYKQLYILTKPRKMKKLIHNFKNKK